MRTRLLLPAALVALLTAGVASRAHLESRQAQAVAPADVRIGITLPQADAELSIDGQSVLGLGAHRDFEAVGLARGAARNYTVVATWKPNPYTTMTRSKTVTVRGGEPAAVDLTREDPSDRVRVIYVPTPQDVAEAMVKLAGVTRQDVVYEPGCGDARITIAAIKAGARRAICVDIDPDRAAESRANVKAAGLADRIDVRLGDALDVKDLTEVTVVLLYMGDHFDMLIRPVLWRDLRVGSRIVSHRFTMGDWAPDRSLQVLSDQGGVYDVHLWTVTEREKRQTKP